MTSDTWNPSQYNKFQREREQPFFDLLAMVQPAAQMRIVDLGCGTGRATRLLHERLHARETLGIDRSSNMLDVQPAEPRLPGLRFEVGTIESFPGDRGAFDLVFSNAALHWVSRHEELLRRLTGALRPGGQLAFQVPASHDQPSHLIAEELTDAEPYRTVFAGWHREQPVRSPEAYARLLFHLGYQEPQVRLVVYPHVLDGPEDVIEWMKGTLLTEYQKHLPRELFDRFVTDYRARLLAQLDDGRPLFFPFKRILCWGRRSA
jgi:trans-aconitate 2-methyltransferase